MDAGGNNDLLHPLFFSFTSRHDPDTVKKYIEKP